MDVVTSAFRLKFVMLLTTLSIARSTLLCPKACRCTGGFPATSLTVDCQRNVNISREQLREQLDSLLSSNLTFGHLKSLRIINTPLTNVPRSMCRLTTLTQLNLDYNQLTRLPDNCLSNLADLTLFSASANHITELQNGVFDGLHKLQTLILSSNTISSIGERVFHCSLKLTKLTMVDLEKNRIQTLEPWPIYLGLNGQPGRKTLIILSFNNISAFSNTMGCNTCCDTNAVHVGLHLRQNPIRHLSDMLRGWNTSITQLSCLFPNQPGRTASFIDISTFHNFMECDCLDFDIYKLAFSPKYSGRLYRSTYCNSPAALFRKRMAAVPLDQFVCELTEHCPPGCRCVHRPANATLHVYCSNTNLTALPLELTEELHQV